ncbi:MAG: TorF family putative porin [Proteobacteria bacterium]|nr:TorF family putative porin [Pseudomonadota bacterium]
MKNTRTSFAVLANLGASVLLASTSVLAQTPTPAEAPAAVPASPLTGNISLTSDYRFRGLSQTGKKPAIQGGLDYANESGVYLGTWWSSVSGNQYPSGSSLETDWYGGYKFEAAKDVGIDLGLIHVYYPGVTITGATPFSVSVPGTTGKADTTEIYAGLSYQWFSAKYNYTIGSSLFGIDYPTAGLACPIGSATGCYSSTKTTKGSGYLDLGANFEIADKMTLNLHVGHQTVANYGNYSYSDYKIGLIKDIAGYNLAAAIFGTNAKDTWWYAQTPSQVGTTNRTKIGESGLVLSVSKTF